MANFDALMAAVLHSTVEAIIQPRQLPYLGREHSGTHLRPTPVDKSWGIIPRLHNAR